MANYYQGTEIKFKIELTAEGFTMDTDPFDITVASQRSSVTGSKTIAVTGASSDSDKKQGSAELSIVRESDGWYGIVETDALSKGELRVIATAHITDTSAYDGVRNEVAVAALGQLLVP